MKTRGSLGWWFVAVVCSASACGQDLVLPTADSRKMPASDGPVDGTTGASGAPAEAPPDERLPIADAPIFTVFGGAGGEEAAGAGDDVATASGGGHASSSGCANNRAGSSGNAGRSGGGGRSSAAGSGGTGAAGTQANGGAAGATGDAGDGSGGATAASPAILFSEYVEGSGSFKALEIYALASSSLEGCELQTYFNGKLEPSRLALHGSLSQGSVQVLCSSALATAQPSLCDRSTSLTFNGDDALALSCGGILLDVIGQIGVDPGDAWAAGATADHTLRRRCSVMAGLRDGSQPFEPDAEWLVFGVDTFSDLGTRDCGE
jgi:hypothetical protein